MTACFYSDWEIHGSKETGQGTSITPGQAFTMEWGFGQALPLKKDLSQLLQVGLIGYDQWQLTQNDGLLAPNIAANVLPFVTRSTQSDFRGTMYCLLKASTCFSSTKTNTRL